jgi:hypothetical protein
MTSDLIPGVRNILVIRYILPDGRTNTLCSWADGEWKVEVFASEAHARDFAAANQMEVIDASRTGA